MQSSHWSEMAQHSVMPIEQFDAIQRRYQVLKLKDRAKMMLEDASPALKAIDEILYSLSRSPKVKPVIVAIRKDKGMIRKIRPSEARNMMLDPHIDFIDMSRRKIAAWRETMQRLADGEGIISEDNLEYIPRHLPVALSYSCSSTVPHYLAIIQLLLGEMEKKDSQKAESYRFSIARVRRCATVLSDCEGAADIATHIH